MPQQPIFQTKSSAALQAIRTRILEGDLKPGDQLRAEALAEELGMSATPVREALRMLQADRLVNHKPHHGIVVAGVSATETHEIYLVRSLLEGPATEMATPNIKGEVLEKLEGIQRRLVERVAKTGGDRDIGPLNAEWHWTIYRAAGSAYLCEVIEEAWDHFPWRTMWAKPQDLDRSVGDHEAVMAAIRAGDAPLAAERMREHILNGPGMLLPGESKEGDDEAA
jgi:DNA-binding GntR family transcriptional regulator